MKPPRILIYASLTVRLAAGADLGSTGDCVTIYVANPFNVPWIAVNSARATTTNIFRDIGVSVHWAQSPNGRREQTCAAVEVRFDPESPATLRPGAMAYAQIRRNNGPQVHILTDRIFHSSPNPSELRYQGALLGHVIAHEVGHVLEGVARHSEQGLMKENWTFQEVLGMAAKNLPFASIDANLIHAGISRTREANKPEAYETSESAQVPMLENYDSSRITGSHD
jgi:hypothetical protein